MRVRTALFCVFYCQAVDVKHADGSLKATSEVDKQVVDDSVKGTTKSAAQAESVEDLRAQLEEANKKIARLEATEELRTQLEAAHEKIALLEQQVQALTARGLPEQGQVASMQVQSNGGAQPIVRGGPGGTLSPAPGQPPGTPPGPASLTPGGLPQNPAYAASLTPGQAPPPTGLAAGGLGAGPAQGKTITFCAKSLGKTPVMPKLPGGTVTINGLTLAGMPIPTGTNFFFSPPDDQCKAKFEYENVATACLQVGTGCTSDPAYAQDQSFLPCTFDTTLNQGGAPRGQTFDVTLTQIFPGAKTAEWAPTGSLPQCPGGCFLYYDMQNKGVGACVVGGPTGAGGLPGASAIASLLAVAFLLN